jgi:hypothetical protein
MDDDVLGQENCIRDVGTPGNIQDSSFEAKLSHVRQVTAWGVLWAAGRVWHTGLAKKQLCCGPAVLPAVGQQKLVEFGQTRHQ